MTEKELKDKYNLKDITLLTEDTLLICSIYDIDNKELNESDLAKIKDYLEILKILNKNILKIRASNISDKKKLDFSKFILNLIIINFIYIQWILKNSILNKYISQVKN